MTGLRKQHAGQRLTEALVLLELRDAARVLESHLLLVGRSQLAEPLLGRLRRARSQLMSTHDQVHRHIEAGNIAAEVKLLSCGYMTEPMSKSALSLLTLSNVTAVCEGGGRTHGEPRAAFSVLAVTSMTEPPRPVVRTAALDDAGFPGYAMGAAAQAIGFTPALLRAAEAAGLFDVARSDGGHRRYRRNDLHRADRARQLVDDGVRIDAAVRIVSLEYQLAAAQAMIDLLRRKSDATKPGGRK